MAELAIVTPLSYSSTPGDKAVRVKRSATYHKHTVQIMKLAKCEKKPVLYLKNLLTCPLNLILEYHSSLQIQMGRKVTFGLAPLVPGIFFLCCIHKL